MSIRNDVLELIAELWDIEQFDMWNPKEHSSLAYLFDRSFHDHEYSDYYDKWLSLARNKDFNEFAWTISQAIVRVGEKDERVSQADKDELDKLLAWQKIDYEAKRLSGFGIVKEKYVPEWFFELFGSYIKLEQAKRENLIIEYLINECSMSDKRAKDAYKKLYEQNDILNEFYFYVRNGRFVTFSPITVEEISAQQLNSSTYLSPVGTYNYFVYLRKSPEEALADLKKGLPRR